MTYEGTIIGDWAGGTNGSEPLTILFNANADVESIQALLRNITYENTSNNPSETQRAVNFSISDGDGGSSNVVTRNVVVNALNSAPELTGANDLNSIDEDLINNGGTLVSILISGWVTDADPGAVSGIAVVGVDNTNGSWEFSTDGGTTWIGLRLAQRRVRRDCWPPTPTPSFASCRTRIGAARSSTASPSMPGTRQAA